VSDIRLDSVAAIKTSGDLRLVVTRAYRAFVLPVRYVVVGPNGPKIKSEPVLGMAVSVLFKRYVAPGELEFPTFWLPRQTVPVKFTLTKSFRFWFVAR